MRILIFDTNRLFGAGIKCLLQASFPGTQVEYASSYADVSARLGAGQFALLVMEIGIAKDNGLCVVKRLHAEYPRLPMLALSSYPLDYYGPKVIRAGASGFLSKDSEPDELVRAVRSMLAGRHYISSELAAQLARGLGLNNGMDTLHERLSPREFQVFGRLAQGESITGIAQALELSVKTVDTHRRKVFQKMGFQTREQLARYAFARGLIPSRRLGE